MPQSTISETRKSSLAAIVLALAVLAVYLQVGGHSFLFYDDEMYVTRNDMVRRGLTPEGLSWALSSTYAANWHPLTWLSHMADVDLFGVDAGRHHLVNVLFHILNTVLLFVVLKRMTGAFWESALVAALFAVHPLHVESVAWVSERKDVLSALFMLLTMNAYLAYARHPGVARYLPVAGFMALGLLAKPMLVTLPFLLLLLDYWPLGRFASLARPPFALIWEKLPLLALSAASCVVTYLAQAGGKTMEPMGYAGPAARVANAIMSYVKYLGKAAWPSSLSVIYPHPAYIQGVVTWKVALAGTFLLLVTGWAILRAKRRPYLAVGWLWYLGTLVPVIGLVQVGVQAMADRYTYIPLIGVFVALVWGISTLVPREPSARRATVAVAVGVLVVLGSLSWRQAGFWKNDITLFTHALEAHPYNQDARWNLCVAHNNRGMELFREGKIRESAAHFREALKMSPLDVTVLLNAGVAEASLGNVDQAIRLFRTVLEVRPGDARAIRNLELTLEQRRQLEPRATPR